MKKSGFKMKGPSLLKMVKNSAMKNLGFIKAKTLEKNPNAKTMNVDGKEMPIKMKKDSAMKKYASYEQQKAVYASKADGGKGNPNKMKKSSMKMKKEDPMKMKKAPAKMKKAPAKMKHKK